MDCSQNTPRDYYLFAAVGIRAGKAEQVIKVGGTNVDIREDRIDRIWIVVVSHEVAHPSDTENVFG